MKKKRKVKSSITTGRLLRPGTGIVKIPISSSPIAKALLARRTKIFARDEPGLATSAIATKTIRPVRPEKIQKKYVGFQLETRVTSCDQKRERRRRAYFGYLKSPHAGKGTKRTSPRSDRFTVKC